MIHRHKSTLVGIRDEILQFLSTEKLLRHRLEVPLPLSLVRPRQIAPTFCSSRLSCCQTPCLPLLSSRPTPNLICGCCHIILDRKKPRLLAELGVSIPSRLKNPTCVIHIMQYKIATPIWFFLHLLDFVRSCVAHSP